MKQTRNAITFLQAQYRAILEHAWARLSAAATLSTAAGVVLSALSTPAATQAATFAASSADYSYLNTTINGESYDSAHSVFTVSSADGYAYPAVAAAFAAQEVLTTSDNLSPEQALWLESAYYEAVSASAATERSLSAGAARRNAITLISAEEAPFNVQQLPSVQSDLDSPFVVPNLAPVSLHLSAPTAQAQHNYPLAPTATLNPEADFSQPLVPFTNPVAAEAALDSLFADGTTSAEYSVVPHDAANDTALLCSGSDFTAPAAHAFAAEPMSLSPWAEVSPLSGFIAPVQVRLPQLGAFSALNAAGKARDAALPQPQADQKPLASTLYALNREGLPAQPRTVRPTAALTAATEAQTVTAASAASASTKSAPVRASVFAPRAPQQSVVTPEDGSLEFYTADGAALRIAAVPEVASPEDRALPTAVGTVTPPLSATAEIAPTEAPSNLFTAMSLPQWQVTLDPAQEYEIALSDDEAVAFTFDLSALGTATHPSQLHISAQDSNSLGRNPFLPQGDSAAAARGSLAPLPEAASGAPLAATTGATTGGFHGSVMVSTHALQAGFAGADAGTADAQLAPQAVLDLEHARYVQAADGQKRLNFDLLLGDNTKLTLKDKMWSDSARPLWAANQGASAATFVPSADQVAAVLGEQRAHTSPWLALKAGHSSVFAPQALTPVTATASAMEQSTVSTSPVQVDIRRPHEPTIALSFTTPEASVGANTNTNANANAQHAGATVATPVPVVGNGSAQSSMPSMAHMAPPSMAMPSMAQSSAAAAASDEALLADAGRVRFMVSDETQVELDLSQLHDRVVAIATTPENTAQDAPAANAVTAADVTATADTTPVTISRDQSSQLLSIVGAQVTLPAFAQATESTTAPAADAVTAPTSEQQAPALSTQVWDDSTAEDALLSAGSVATAANTSVPVSSLQKVDNGQHMVVNFVRATPENTIVIGFNQEGQPQKGFTTSSVSGDFATLQTASGLDWVKLDPATTLRLNGTAQGNSNSLLLSTTADEVVGVHLGADSSLQLQGSGKIGAVMGPGRVEISDADVQVVSRQGERADVAVQSVSLDNASLQVRDLAVEHFAANNAALNAENLIIGQPEVKWPQWTQESNAHGAAISSSALSPATTGKKPESPALPRSGSESAATTEQGNTALRGSFSAVNSDIQARQIDLTGVAQAHIVGGSLLAQNLAAHNLSIRHGTSAFVQDIELHTVDGVTGVLAVGSTAADVQRDSTVVAAPKSQVHSATASATATSSAATSASTAAAATTAKAKAPLSADSYKFKSTTESEEAFNLFDPTAFMREPSSGFSTNLRSENIELNGGLLQLYSSDPQEHVSVFTHALESKRKAAARRDGTTQLSGNVIIGANSALGIGPDYAAFVSARERFSAEQESKGQPGAYLYVDRAGVALGQHKIVMGTESLAFLQKMLRSPYSIYLGQNAALEVSSRALYGVAQTSGLKTKSLTSLTPYSPYSVVGGSFYPRAVFSDMDGKVIASQGGRLIVPVNTKSRDLARIFGTSVILRPGDVINVSTENRAWTGTITSSEQLQGKKPFVFDLNANAYDILNLATPTYDQALRIITTPVQTYSLDTFNVSTQSLEDSTNSLSSGPVVEVHPDINSNSIAGDATNNILNGSNDLPDSNSIADTVQDSVTGVTVASDVIAITESPADADATGTSTGSGDSGTAVDASNSNSINASLMSAVTDTGEPIADADSLESGDAASTEATAEADSALAATGSGGSSDGSGSTTAASEAQASTASRQQVVVEKDSVGYAFLIDALGSVHSDVVEKVSRLAILGGALHGVHMVSTTAYEAMHSRLGVGVNAALAVNNNRKGNITISDNTQGSALWFTPMYRSFNAADLGAQGREYGTDLELYGMVMGLDYSWQNKARFGLMWNVGAGQAEGKDVAAGISNDFNFYGFGAYLGVNPTSKLALSADIAYTMSDNDLSAAAQLKNWNEIEANADSQELSVGVGAQYTFNTHAVEVSPHVGLRFSKLDLDSYEVKIDEKVVASSSTEAMHIFSIPVGVTLARDFSVDNWVVRPAFDLTVTANVGDTSMDSTTVFSGISGADFKYETDILDHLTYGATVGFSGASDNIAFGFNVGYTTSSHSNDVAGAAQVRYIF